MPVAVFLIETCALAITAPEASVTVPLRVAPVTCARTGAEVNKQKTKARNTPIATTFFISIPPSVVCTILTLNTHSAADAAPLHVGQGLIKLFPPKDLNF